MTWALAYIKIYIGSCHLGKFEMQFVERIQDKIYEIRGERIMLDRDLAILYGTETKSLNLAVRRGISAVSKRFHV